jgi:hypothetical protein
MFKLIKLITGEVVFGEEANIFEDKVELIRPYSFITQNGQISLVPYDAMLVQGDMQTVDFIKKNIIYTTKLNDLTIAFDAYKRATSTIITGTNSKIIV